jgi:ABC-type antimicrobial peptide transport system permease subunit
VGKRVSFTVGNTPTAWLDIVGVVGDVRQDGLDVPVTPTIYLPMLQSPNGFAFLVVRERVGEPGTQRYWDVSGLTAGIRGAIADVDSDQPIFTVRTMNDIYGDAVAGRRFNMIILVAFGALGLLLAGVGVYGILAYAVSRRTQEIGVRMAMGARRYQVLRLVVGQAVTLSLAGIGLGIAGSVFLTYFMSALLLEVRFYDPSTVVAVSSIVFGLALLAGFVPAWRAARVDPSLALRSQ